MLAIMLAIMLAVMLAIEEDCIDILYQDHKQFRNAA